VKNLDSNRRLGPRFQQWLRAEYTQCQSVIVTAEYFMALNMAIEKLDAAKKRLMGETK